MPPKHTSAGLDLNSHHQKSQTIRKRNFHKVLAIDQYARLTKRALRVQMRAF